MSNTKTPDEVAKYVADVKAALSDGKAVTMKVTWRPVGSTSLAKTWSGPAKLYMNKSTHVRDYLVVGWKEGEKTPKGNTRMYGFPQPANLIEYTSLDFLTEVQMIPERHADDDDVSDAGSAVDFPPEEVQEFTFDPKSWRRFIEADDKGMAMDVLRLRLVDIFKVTPSSSVERTDHVEGVYLWARAAQEMEGWDGGAMLALGAWIVRLSRNVISREEGVDMVALRREMHVTDHPGDPYGAAVAKLQQKERPREDRPQRKKPFCLHCRKPGHRKDTCWQLRPDLRPAQTERQQDFQKGGQGSLPVSKSK